jgi:DNA invertase Pin-like site-specific DNA recombinase
MESGKINCCISKDLSRLGRNAIDSGYYIERHFPAMGVRYIAITDNYDSANGQSGGIMVSLKNMFNEAYALDISRKIKATVRMNIRKGKFIGSSAPYGYLKSPDDCHRLILDDYAASIVRVMFEMAANGQSHQTILAWLNDNRIMPPRRYFNSIGLASDKETGALTEWWSLRAVRDTLQNKVYCGVMIQGRSKMISGVHTKLPESEWTVTENAHEAIVSYELYEAVQKAWGRKAPAKEPYYKSPNTENIFARKLFCGQCGYAVLRKRGGEKHYRYLCKVAKYYTQDACGGFKIVESALKEIVLEMILRYEPFLEQALLPEANTPDTSASGRLKNELAAARYEHDKNGRYLKGLYESLVSGDISDAEYKDMRGDYESKIAFLAGQIKDLLEKIHIAAEQEKALSQAHASVRTIKQASDLTGEIIDKLIEKITVYPDHIEVKFRFLDEVVCNSEGINAEGGVAV